MALPLPWARRFTLTFPFFSVGSSMSGTIATRDSSDAMAEQSIPPTCAGTAQGRKQQELGDGEVATDSSKLDEIVRLPAAGFNIHAFDMHSDKKKGKFITSSKLSSSQWFD